MLLLEGAPILLVVLIIFVFLRSWRSTLIPAIAIPISLIGGFFIMYVAGYSINVLTLLALILAIFHPVPAIPVAVCLLAACAGYALAYLGWNWHEPALDRGVDHAWDMFAGRVQQPGPFIIEDSAFLASLALAAVPGCGKNRIEYRVAPVERGNIEETVTATGTVNPVTTVLVGTQVSGTIKALYADYNSRVRKGQVVAQLEPSLFETQVEQARAAWHRLGPLPGADGAQLEERFAKAVALGTLDPHPSGAPAPVFRSHRVLRGPLPSKALEK